MWSPRALTLLLGAVVVSVWLSICVLFMIIRSATRWTLDRIPEPARGPGPAHPAYAAYAARQHAGIAALADLASPERERTDCRCRFWNSEGDRLEWLPCGDHLEAMIRDARAS